MNIQIIVPKVVTGYISQFPEVTNNAYDYFNYDHRVVNERVNRGDSELPYKDASDFSDLDYVALVSYAKTLVNPMLAKSSIRAACEDALNTAIRSFCNGLFDGKVNAGHFNVLVGALNPKAKTAKKEAPAKAPKKAPEKKPDILNRRQVKNLGLLGLKPGDKGIKAPRILKEKGKFVLKK